MNKDDYKNLLRRQYPDEKENTYELCWVLHDMEKTKQYIPLLETCIDYPELAQNVVRRMYVSGDIIAERAVKEEFIALLLSFTYMEKGANAHTAAHHIRKVINDKNVKRERLMYENIRVWKEGITQKGGTLSANNHVMLALYTDKFTIGDIGRLLNLPMVA